MKRYRGVVRQTKDHIPCSGITFEGILSGLSICHGVSLENVAKVHETTLIIGRMSTLADSEKITDSREQRQSSKEKRIKATLF